MKKNYLALIVLLIIAIGVVAGAFMYIKNPSTSNLATSTAPVVETPPPVLTGLVVTNLQENGTVASGFTVLGYTNGDGWGGFEGYVGTVSLYDANNNLLVTKALAATSDWMTSTVQFAATLDFLTTSTVGTIVFKNENASGEPSRDKQVSWSVNLVPASNIMQLQAYFSNGKLDPQINCEKVFPVTRTVLQASGTARAAITELLKGPSMAEQMDGYVTNINEGVKINSLSVVNGVAKVDFNNAIETGVGGACRVTAIRAQIVDTLNQFDTVSSVVISVDGRTEDILQP